MTCACLRFDCRHLLSFIGLGALLVPRALLQVEFPESLPYHDMVSLAGQRIGGGTGKKEGRKSDEKIKQKAVSDTLDPSSLHYLRF